MSESVSEFFDAQEVLLSASSSENEVRVLGASISFACNCESGQRLPASRTLGCYRCLFMSRDKAHLIAGWKRFKLPWRFPFPEHFTVLLAATQGS